MMASKENLYNFRFILIISLLVCFDIFSKVVANNNLLFGQSVDTAFPLPPKISLPSSIISKFFVLKIKSFAKAES